MLLRRHVLVAAAAGLAAPATLRAQGAWRPDRPVTIIVPWAAGGSTDQMARLVAAELEAPLGQRVVVVNQPGASGSIGTRNALEAPKDGMTWAAGAAVDVGCYKVLGLLDTQLSDWNLFFAVANVNVLVANPQSGFRDFAQAFEALKTRGQSIGVATAGVSSAGHNMMEALRAATPGLQYRHATYDGGNPAMIATVSGETQLGAMLLVEAAEMIRARRLIPLAVQSDDPVTLAAQGSSPAIEIPSVRRWVPNMPAPLNYFGIWAAKGVPENVVATMTEIWRTTIANSQRLKDYATSRAALFTPLYGQQAYDEAWKMVRQTAWLYFDGGKARVSPDTVGIARL
ncbi:tripartite tricarboxylate transporter substrate binding protein [Roseomonas terrae]|jgi:tripartite-type tricarboxylate transporter receptor subunit TctC|uniref:Tripartite tricarboxylate transporter substrate binding protein n=1 Tax=Neoroseomonas terrae TaxID=424799 RepID=A0ABS5EBL8_9PROT|nr:tripartite tricarboxylate transporter substrate binding protein [Neoroseomonas terrae]MBR0648424.1 tripartite tricarboxylate transporter substrate binding protein [Neoroseomonas terrae]